MSKAPLARHYNLGRLPHAGETVSIISTEAERVAIAGWAGLLGVTKWNAEIELQKLSPTRFTLHGTLAADLVQSCVVTLEPVLAHIEHAFTRDLNFTGMPRRGMPTSELDSFPILEDEEAPEEIESLHYDLAGPVLEEFSLALDPYPRVPGAAFQALADPEAAPESPFAVLKRLKSGH